MSCRAGTSSFSDSNLERGFWMFTVIWSDSGVGISVVGYLAPNGQVNIYSGGGHQIIRSVITEHRVGQTPRLGIIQHMLGRL